MEKRVLKIRISVLALALCAVFSASAQSSLTPTVVTTPASTTPTEATTTAVEQVFVPPPVEMNDPAKPAAVPATSMDVAVSSASLWGRIRGGFQMPDLQTDLVADRERFYSQRPEYMARMTERGSKYLHHIVEELERRNMPAELALLPFVESAFVVNAVSSAKAAGMWQFMPGTGRDFSLKQNLFRDDRRDVQQSTRAALDYLQRLHKMFGDWHLALAAYNWGEGSVQRAIKKNEAAGLPTGYLDLKMPDETRLYVPKLQAIKNIVLNPQVFNVNLPEIDNHPYFQGIKIQRDMDVALAARLAEVKLEDFKALNPSANKPVIFAAGTPQVLLPWNNAEVFIRNLQSYRGRLASYTAWTVPSNMRPADAARRVGMSEEALRELNRIPPRHSIRAGSTLLVPRGERVTQEVSQQVADNATLGLQADPVKVCRKVKSKGKTKQVCKNVVLRAGQAKGKGKSVAAAAPSKMSSKASGKALGKSASKASAKPDAKASAKPRTVSKATAKAPAKKAASTKQR